MTSPVELNRLRALESDYEDNADTKKLLADKVLTMVLAPTGVGKSTIIQQVIQAQANQSLSTWGEPGSLTTRDRRPDDSRSYQTADEGITHSALTKRILDGSLTNYSVHPSGHIYATGPESFTYDYNLMPTLPSSVAALKRAGFKATHTVFLTAEPHDLKHGLAARESDPSFHNRLQEGLANIDYALSNADTIHFIRNSHELGGKEMAADQLIAASLEDYEGDKDSELKVVQSIHRYIKGRLGK